MTNIRQTTLPGVGIRHDFVTRAGQLVGAIAFRSGRLELFIAETDDPDTPRATADLTSEDRRALSEILGGSGVVTAEEAQQRVEGLAIDWVSVPDRSPFVGRTIGDTAARTRTGVSIVAILRDGTAVAAPGPEEELHAGDTLLVVGTAPGVEAFTSSLGP